MRLDESQPERETGPMQNENRMYLGTDVRGETPTCRDIPLEAAADVRGRVGLLGEVRPVASGVAMSAVAAGLLACGGGVGPPVGERFGQIGSVVISVRTPLFLGEGSFRQALQWHTSGAWSLHEEIAYRGRTGGVATSGSVGDPSHLAPSYAELLVRLHEASGLSLFIQELPQGVTADCGNSRSSITFAIHDVQREETVDWQQCLDGSLSTMTERGAGPLPAATRLVAAGIQVRDATVGPHHRSPYYGSIPFGTIWQSDDPAMTDSEPRLVEDEATWRRFWSAIGVADDIPVVDFDSDYVMAILVGERREAGQTVAVRSIFQTSGGTIAQYVERVPGDFCSPVSTTRYPFHIVVAPRSRAPHQFVRLPTEYVPCGP